MAAKEGYDVLRLIEHGQTCYISSEYIEGIPLTRWLKYHPNLPKEQLFRWMQSAAAQLGQIHKCKSRSCYQYVNPYSIIVTEEGGLYFLDPEAASNEEMRRKMQRRDIREHFLPPEQPYYHKGSISADIYGLGRTFQYLLSVTVSEPALTRLEEARLRKVISRSLKRESKSSYQSMSDMRRHLPVYQPKEERKVSKYAEKMPGSKVPGRRKALAAAALLIVAVSLCKVLLPRGRDDQSEEGSKKGEISTEHQKGTALEERGEETPSAEQPLDEVYLDVILSYFLDLKDYEKCLAYLEKVQEQYPLAEQIKTVVERYADGEKKVSDQELEQALGTLEEELPSEDEIPYLRFLIKGYAALESEEGAKELIEIGDVCLETERLNQEEEREVLEYTALALERAGREEESAGRYARLLELVTEEQKKEELYKRMIALYESCDMGEQAVKVCIEGIEELPESEELRVMHIRLLCSDESIDRAVCAQVIQEHMRQIPELQAGEDFQKIQKEYEIRVEGEGVWVGK